MRFLADEGIERAIVEFLRVSGYDVCWILESAPGLEDAQVAALAMQERRILITHDKDFGNLAVRQGYALVGVILLRLHRLSSMQKAERTLQVIQSLEAQLENHFVVIQERGVRLRPLSHPRG